MADRSRRHQNGSFILMLITGPLTSELVQLETTRGVMTCVPAAVCSWCLWSSCGWVLRDRWGEDGSCRCSSSDHCSAPSGHFPPLHSSSDSSLWIFLPSSSKMTCTAPPKQNKKKHSFFFVASLRQKVSEQPYAFQLFYCHVLFRNKFWSADH